ncbi:hypothetical protein PRUPE_3G140500 [Prunus persica]|uniref:Uncharacterized protein n=1 Tax=Prunus persica TaxID=3760 RepID=M5VGF4_PRUPE|nr:hypothetical protein PRUPE_3G140500 [Prunus persica]
MDSRPGPRCSWQKIWRVTSNGVGLREDGMICWSGALGFAGEHDWVAAGLVICYGRMFGADTQLFATRSATGDAQRMCGWVFELDEVRPRFGAVGSCGFFFGLEPWDVCG